MKRETITLTSGRSLITPNTTDKFKHCVGKSCQVLTKENVDQFGLFETNSPNFNTYYPDVTAEDLKPQEDEFIYPVFRALTATSIRKYLPIDFSKAGVLKGSMNKLEGISIMTDHEMNTGNVLGAVKSAVWQDEYKVDGLTVPAGINVTLAIDGKSHPQIARGIMMNPPSYHSVSVTVSYMWEWSHALKDDQDPYMLWGSTMADGEVLRKVATEIAIYQEISIVPLGADPFARLVTDGTMTNPQFVKDRQSLSASFSEAGLLDQGYINYAQFGENSPHFINPNIDDDMNVSEFMESLGLGKDTTEVQLKEQLVALNAKASTLDKLIAKKEDINEESLQNLIDNQKSEEDVATLKFVEDNAGKDKLTEAIEFQTNSLTEKRKKAVNFYKLTKGDDAKDTIIETINNSNGETLDEFLSQNQAEYEEKVPLTCSKCGSEEVSRKASAKEDLTDSMSLQDTLLAAKRKAAVDRIHGKASE